MNDQIRRIEKALDRFLPETDALYKTVTDAMRYSLLNGGKRVRAVLALEFCKLCGGTEEEAMPFACAVEMVHAYSLIAKPRRAVLLLTMGRHDPFSAEVCERMLRQSFSVMNTHLAGTLCLTDTDGGIDPENPVFEKARRMAIEIAGESCYNNLNLCE